MGKGKIKIIKIGEIGDMDEVIDVISDVDDNEPPFYDGGSLQAFKRRLQKFKQRSKNKSKKNKGNKDNTETFTTPSTKSNISKSDYPVWEKNDNMVKYFKKIEKIKTAMVADKYTIVLTFINKLLKLKGKSKYKSLLEFKKVKESSIKQRFIKMDKTKLKVELGIKSFYKNTDVDDYVIHCLRVIMYQVGYKVIRKFDRENDNIYLSLRN